jgi:replicative DNA helicase
MNPMPQPSEFAIASPAFPAPVIETEQALLGLLLNRPDLAPEILSKIEPGDIVEPLHFQILEGLCAIVAEEKSISIPGLIARIGSDEELAAGLTVNAYIARLGREGLSHFATPPKALLEVLREARIRRELHVIGETIIRASATGSVSVPDLASDAVSRLDDIVALTRPGKRRSFSGAQAATLALEHLKGGEGSYPTCGLVDLDAMIGGWPRGQLSIVAGRPGMGKSAAATSLVLGAAKKSLACQFFSLEMTGEQLGARLLTDLAYTAQRPIFYEDIVKRNVDGRDLLRLQEAQTRLEGLPLRVEEQRGLTLAEIAARARKHAAELDRNGEKLELVVVDHMLLIRASSRYAGNRVREVAEISDGLATLAKELNVSVVALCQLNRGVEGRDNKRPGLADLRDSGAIEEDASVVCFVYRPAYYLENTRFDNQEEETKRIEKLEKCRNTLEFVVAKNRNGRTGVVRAFVDIGANAIRNAAYGG